MKNTIHKILLPTDFSRCSRQALHDAVSLAEHSDAELHVLHALVLHGEDAFDPASYLPEAPNLLQEAQYSAEAAMDVLLDPYRSTGVALYAAHCHDLFAAPAILDYAAKHQIDLIVLGTHGRTGPARLLLGSVAEAVVARSTCPVLVRHEYRGELRALRPSRILVPLDFTLAARRALRWAAILAASFGSELELFHADTRPQWSLSGSSVTLRSLGDEPQAETKQSRAALQVMAELEALSVPFSITLAEGRPAESILERTGGADIDLVVMATEGMKGVRRLLSPSTAAAVLRKAPCPTLVVPPPPPRIHSVTENQAVESSRGESQSGSENGGHKSFSVPN